MNYNYTHTYIYIYIYSYMKFHDISNDGRQSMAELVLVSLRCTFRTSRPCRRRLWLSWKKLLPRALISSWWMRCLEMAILRTCLWTKRLAESANFDLQGGSGGAESLRRRAQASSTVMICNVGSVAFLGSSDCHFFHSLTGDLFVHLST